MREERDNQIRRTARLLEIIQQIATAPHYWTRKRLADYHQVSERMIQKDLEIIRLRLGLTIKTEGDGYYFIRLPQLPATLFSFSEAIALLSAARAAQAMPGVNSTELAVAITRLESIFPEEIRPLLKDTLDHLPRKAIKTHRQTMLTLFYRAYFEQKQIQMVYQPQKEKVGIQRWSIPISSCRMVVPGMSLPMITCVNLFYSLNWTGWRPPSYWKAPINAPKILI